MRQTDRYERFFLKMPKKFLQSVFIVEISVKKNQSRVSGEIGMSYSSPSKEDGSPDMTALDSRGLITTPFRMMGSSE